MSYLPPFKRWYIHPGDETLALYDPPSRLSPGESRTCLSCHSVTQPDDTFMPKPQFFGVGCESCHGPSAAHAAAAKAGSKDLRIESIGKWGAARINQMCGRCHAKPGSAPEEMLTDPKEMRRYAPNALMQSRCFVQSLDALSCITCHAPHADASQNRPEYDRVCLSCHTSNENQPNRGSLCPVNAVSKCTSCHMKPGKFEPKSDLPTEMTDHYIRVPGRNQPVE